MSSADERSDRGPRSRRRRSPAYSDDESLHARKRRKSASLDRDRSRSRSPPRRRHRERSREPRRRHSSASGDRSRDQSRDRKHGREERRERDREGHGTKDVKRRRSRSRSRSRDRHRHRDRPRDRSRDREHRSDRDKRRPRKSPSPKRPKSPARSPIRKRGPLPSQNDSYQASGSELISRPDGSAPGPPVDKQKPNFGNTGILAREANRVEGTNISLKYHEPPEARKPPGSNKWSLLIFKGTDHLSTADLWPRSCWLIGRERKVCDLLAEHGSISGQHAVIQFRWVLKKRKAGQEEWEESKQKGRVKPYLIDLDSANGTILNGEPIEKSRYVELRSGDVIKFGQSEREYVVMLPPSEA